jgi:hypothetical protein
LRWPLFPLLANQIEAAFDGPLGAVELFGQLDVLFIGRPQGDAAESVAGQPDKLGELAQVTLL